MPGVQEGPNKERRDHHGAPRVHAKAFQAPVEGALRYPQRSTDEHLNVRSFLRLEGKEILPPHQNEIILEAHPKPGTLHTLAIQIWKTL